MDAAIERLDELVHVLPPPVGTGEFAAGRKVTLPRGAIGEFEILRGRSGARIGERGGVGLGGPAVGDRIRIKVIVEVDAIEVVVADDFAHDIERAFLGHGFTGVHPHQLAVSFNHAGVRLREMARVEFGNRALVAGAVGIEPRVQLKAPTVRGGDPLAQRIVERLGRAALFPGEKLRPRLERRRIDRIGGRAHLKHDRVEAQGLRAVENG